MNEDTQILTKVFAEVCEGMAFMFAECSDEDDFPEAEPPFIQAQMGFHGPFNGHILIAVPEEMCPEIAANVLGLDPGDELVIHQPYDALKELLNVTCGNLLTAIAGETPVFDLTVPLVEKLDQQGWEAFQKQKATVSFIVDENPVLLQLRREDWVA